MLPNEEGEIWHNTFYNEISSNNIENLDKLINKWPHNLEELDEVLAKAYGELKLKNVRLENETEIFIENKLINLRFFSDTSRHEQIISDVDGQLIITKALQVIDQHLKSTLEFSKLLNNIRERIELTVESIRLLKTDYSNTEKVDGKFIFLAKFIAKNIHVLKQQLNSTHDRLPWEQMEFCLVIFIASYTKRQEMNLYYRATLNKRKILCHIENFAVELEAQKGELLSSKHESEVTKIINGYPGFEELYKDNQQIREVQSLVKISDHIKSKVLRCNPKKKDGQLIIAKALNLIGEYLESTWEFSKLFNNITTSEQNNTSKIIEELRNSLSLLATSPPERIGTEENRDFNFSVNVQEDVSKVGHVITRILNEVNTNKEGIFVKNELMSLSSFFKDPTYKSDNDKNTLIELILQNISLLKRNYSNMEEVDEKFIFTTKSIEQSISKIERQLKLNCDRLPWKEMEFCLSSFVTSYTKKQEMNPFYRALLNKFRILSHLENFAKKLEDENIENEQVVTKNSIPEFEDLYKDFQQIRDVHSLRKISDHIKLALSTNLNETDGLLIITRVLQVIGEHLTKTQGSPKLSDTISELQLLSLQKKARNILKELRDLLSHDDNDSLSKRREFEKKVDDNFFLNIKNDMKKVGTVITDILYNTEIEIIKIVLNQIVACENFDEMNEVAELFNTVKFDEIGGPENFKIMEHEKLEELLNEFINNISDKTDYEKHIFNQINCEIKRLRSRSDNLRSGYVNRVLKLNNVINSLNVIKHGPDHIKLIKFLSIEALLNISSGIEFATWKNISESIIAIIKIIFSRNPSIIENKLELIYDIFYIVKYGKDDIMWIEKIKDKLNKESSFTSTKKGKNKQSKIYKVTEEQYNKQLEVKLSELKRILSKINSLSGSATDKLSFYKHDKKSQVVVEMIVLDIMAILDNLKNYLENNLLLLDDNAPLLNGKCLRNHLAHDNALFEVLLSDPSMAVILNAKKLTEENIIIQSKKKLGMLIKDDLYKLREKYNRDLFIITNQERMFVALEEGHLEIVKDCLKNGADVNARSINSWTTLHFAAKGPSLEVVEFIMSWAPLNLRGINVSDDYSGQSPLHIAAAHGRTSIVEYFIKRYLFNVRSLNNRGATPMHLAAQNGHKDTVKVLLKNKANTVTKDECYRTPVDYAILNNHTDVAKFLLKRSKSFGNKTVNNGPLLLAAYVGNLDVVNFLLEHNVEVNVTADDNGTPLHLAASNGHLEVVNSLIAKGADVNVMAPTLTGCTPLQYAIANGHEKIVNILLKHTDNVNAFNPINGNSHLHSAVEVGHLGIVKTLLENGAEVNFPNLENRTPLHFAGQFGRSEMCSAFLEYRVTIDARDKNNFTPLHYAAENGQIEAVEVLIKNGADLNSRGNKDVTPLYLAAMKGHKDVIDFLIKNKAEVNTASNDGKTPLHEAAFHEHEDAVKVLVQNNADINAKDNNGVTSLGAAVIGGNKDVVKILIENNIEADTISNNHGANIKLDALKFAVYRGHTDIVKILLENEDIVNMPIDKENVTLLHLAASEGHKEIVNVLLKNGANPNAISVVLEIPYTPLSLASIQNGHEEIIEILIENKANVNLESAVSPLHVAAMLGHSNVVKVLLKNNADINMKFSNLSPVEVAVVSGQLQVVKMLLKHNNLLDKEAKGVDGYTLLHTASEESNLEMVEYLVDVGFDINARNTFGAKSMHLAARGGHKATLDYFLRTKGLSIDDPGASNKTLLHYAAYGGHLEVVNYLIVEGADVNAKDDNGLTALHIAVQFGYKEVIQVLIKNGALYNAVDHAWIQQLFQDSNGGLFHRFNRKIKKLITPSIFFPIIFVFMFYICGVAFGQIEISAIM